MANRRAKHAQSSPQSPAALLGDAVAAGGPRLAGGKLWLFRLAALVLAPIVCFGLAELVLVLTGFGYPTAFLLTAQRGEQDVLVQNNQFGWRFFGRDLARWPYPVSIPRSKATNTVRIFVLGESAARGEPQPDFGVARVLQAMLSLKYPGVRFEVVNTAMTAINSHAIMPIARDCATAQGDVWVVYMGNNEVVGPFGAGTVFGSQAAPLTLIRASLALKATRMGQFLDSTTQWFQKSPLDDTGWGGMTMFLNQQVRADDPRMSGVHHHFERNLAEIIRAGHQSGAGGVVSTVAVNLKDCPPLASAHRRGLSESDKSNWDLRYQLGAAAQEAGNNQEAAEHFKAAAALDDTFAELRFRLGQCALALGDSLEAQRHFQVARDLDTLRFRCDGKLNDIIRQAATNRANERILLADTERVFAGQNHAGLPGEEFFCEHVHLTFDGNYLLARTLAEKVEKVLPAWVAARNVTETPWPSQADCARRLDRSGWNEAAALNSIIATLNDPPFTGQLHHETQMRRLEAALAKLAVATQPAGVSQALRLSEKALADAPDDPALYKLLAIMKKAAGDFAGAAAAARRELELLPSDAESWALLGAILAQQNQLDPAAVAFRRGFQLGPQGIKSSLDLAGALATLGKHEEAIREYRRILAMKPRWVPALLQLGQVVEKLGRKAETEVYFRPALTNRSHRLPELMELGGFFQSRGAFQSAVEVYQSAIKLNPSNALLQLGAGRNLASLGRYEAAARHSAEAVRLVPEFVEARLLHGIVLRRRGLVPPAIEQFQEALRLRPESVDARLNLGLLLAQTGRGAEAFGLFQEVLQRNPTNALALKYVQSLRGDGSLQPSADRAKPNSNLPSR